MAEGSKIEASKESKQKNMDDYISEVSSSEQTNMKSGTTTTRQLKGLTITVIENSALNPAPSCI